jgi:hypothetical protein
MADSKLSKSKDEDLLANAIPIDSMGDEPAPRPAADGPTPVEMAEADENTPAREIKSFARVRVQDDQWNRKPHITGRGAIHMRSFFAKLRMDAIENLDKQVNDWLDQHPDYEVKFVTSATGVLAGKISEPALFLTVWV